MSLGPRSRPERCAWPETEDPLQVELDDQPVCRCLPVFPNDFRQNQFGGVSVITATQACLNNQQFSSFFEGHRLILVKQKGGQLPPLRNYFNSNALSFFGTATFLSRTYCGMPFL